MYVILTLRRPMTLATLSLTAVLAYILARFTVLAVAGFFPNTIIPPIPPQNLAEVAVRGKGDETDFEAIIRRNIFDAEESVFSTTTVASTEEDSETKTDEAPAKPDEAPDNKEAVLTSLNIRLLSTFSLGSGVNPQSSAVIQAGAKPIVCRVGDKNKLAANTEVKRILAKRVEFLNGGRLEYVNLEEFSKGLASAPRRAPTNTLITSAPTEMTVGTPTEEPGVGIEQNGDTYTIRRSEIMKVLGNLNSILQQARVMPAVQNNVYQGLRLVSIAPGSFFEKLGLRRGDILKTINGRVLDMSSGFSMFNELKSETSFSLEVDRRGQPQTLSYQIID